MGRKDSWVWHSCPMYCIFVNLFTRARWHGGYRVRAMAAAGLTHIGYRRMDSVCG